MTHLSQISHRTRRGQMFIDYEILCIQPRRGAREYENNVIPLGLGFGFRTISYNPAIPSGLSIA
jgi:hypothetical protein